MWKKYLSISLILLALLGWAIGLLQSPVVNREILSKNKDLARIKQENSPEMQEAKLLAQAYWARYSDVRNSSYFGPQGPNGLFGPREHYNQYGRSEGRIFAPLIMADNIAEEQLLAEAYWQKYPEIAGSDIWGRESELGIHGPRDHYYYFGRNNGYIWGQDPPDGKQQSLFTQ